MKLILRSLVITAVLMVAIALEEGVGSAYAMAVYGVYCADCLRLGWVLGWFLVRIPVAKHCLDAVFSRILRAYIDDAERTQLQQTN